MLWLLSWDDANWLSMFHTWGGYHHVLTVVRRLWKLTEHVLYVRGCQEALTVVMRGWQLIEIVSYFRETTMLCPFSWDDGNYLSMFHSRGGLIKLWPLSWEDDIWQSMFHTWGGITMLCTLSWDNKWRSMFQALGIKNYALSVFMWCWQLTMHYAYLKVVSPCSECWDDDN